MDSIARIRIDSVIDYYEHLRRLTEDADITPETVAEALSKLCSCVDKSVLIDDCKKMQNGIDVFRELYTQYGAADNREISLGILNKAVSGMSEAERKGFYLQTFESLRESDSETAESALVEAADLATLTEDEIREILTEQWSNTADKLIYEISDRLETSETNSDKRMMKEPLLMAAAEYAAVINGDFPDEFGRHPEMLGADSAAYEALIICLENGGGVNIKEILVAFALILTGIALLALLPGIGAGMSIAVDAAVMKLGSGWFVSLGFFFLEVVAFAAIAFIPVLSLATGVDMLMNETGESIKKFYRSLHDKFQTKKADKKGIMEQSKEPCNEENEKPYELEKTEETKETRETKETENIDNPIYVN